MQIKVKQNRKLFPKTLKHALIFIALHLAFDLASLSVRAQCDK